jgi:hypothetical protein
MKNLSKSEQQEYETYYLILLHPKTEYTIYFGTIETTYDVEDLRTWKSACI